LEVKKEILPLPSQNEKGEAKSKTKKVLKKVKKVLEEEQKALPLQSQK
jgi:hypothetical protein